MTSITEAVRFYDEAPEVADFRDEVRRGLSAQPKAIAPKFFYDRRGSELFDRICELPEYYIPRIEMGILRQCAREVARLIGPDCMLVELGSGASRKVRLVLEALRPEAYCGVDISREFLLHSTQRLARDYPWLEVHAACADLCRPLAISDLPKRRRRLAFYPGSSIGNFEPAEAREFMHGLRSLLGFDGALLIGVDLKKDRQLLHAAYNDRAGVTAAFNLNLLSRLRRELGVELNPAAFEHRAFYNDQAGRIEMHLVSREPQRLRIDGGEFALAQGETIHTENSYKYSIAEFHVLARAAGYAVEKTWTDVDDLFSVHYLSVAN
jgi:dimethylhistidine N-methyltransferase